MEWLKLLNSEDAVSVKTLLLIVWLGYITFSLRPLKKIDDIKSALAFIQGALVAKKIIPSPFVRTASPKQITEQGYNLLKNHKTTVYLEKYCELLKNDFKGQTDSQIFIKCSDWVKESGKEKLVDLRLNSDIMEEDAIMLIALFIMEKIKDKKQKSGKA